MFSNGVVPATQVVPVNPSRDFTFTSAGSVKIRAWYSGGVLAAEVLNRGKAIMKLDHFSFGGVVSSSLDENAFIGILVMSLYEIDSFEPYINTFDRALQSWVFGLTR